MGDDSRGESKRLLSGLAQMICQWRVKKLCTKNPQKMLTLKVLSRHRLARGEEGRGKKTSQMTTTDKHLSSSKLGTDSNKI